MYNKYRCTYKEINNVKLIKTLTIRDIKRALVFVLVENIVISIKNLYLLL